VEQPLEQVGTPFVAHAEAAVAAPIDIGLIV
jgi:hypothetical protein